MLVIVVVVTVDKHQHIRLLTTFSLLQPAASRGRSHRISIDHSSVTGEQQSQHLLDLAIV